MSVQSIALTICELVTKAPVIVHNNAASKTNYSPTMTR